jgi:hypothetical protein
MLTDKELKGLLEKIRNLKLPEQSDKEIDLASLPIEGKVFYFDTVKQVPTFKILRNSIQTICELVAPIYPQISPLRYFELLFDRIDFNDIENVLSQEQGLKFSKLIFEVLNDGLKSDIDTQLLQFQKGIPKLSITEVIEVQKEIIGKKDTLTNWVKGRIRNVSFTERYLNFCKSIEKEDTENKGFLSFDFTFLIYSFHDVIIDELLSSYETLSKSLNEIIPLLKSEPAPAIPIVKQETKADRLKVKQIALIYIYEGNSITRVNAGEIAKVYGYNSATSGEGLFQDYTKFSSKANRIGTPETLIKRNNKIELFEGVLPHLITDKAKEWALIEIEIMKAKFKEEA